MNDQWFLFLWICGHLLYSLGAVYYLTVSIPAYVKGRKEYRIPLAPDVQTIHDLLQQKGSSHIPFCSFQITTKGNETHVVMRGIRSILEIAREPLFRERMRIDVVTEEDEDKRILESMFGDCVIPLTIHLVPQDYATPRGTLKKARALHYMIEERKSQRGKTEKGGGEKIEAQGGSLSSPPRSYIIYLDSESVLESEDFRKMIFSLVKHGKKITEGPITYPIQWFDANIISRQMEATRPWHCYHCHEVMVHPPPQHLHGSNLVVEEDTALELGWDFGNLDGEAFVAEDLVFGLKAYLRYGGDVFAWHGAQLLEQPPKVVRDSVRQRIRWVTGIWQALEMLKRNKDFKNLPRRERLALRMKIGLRAMLYSLGFFSAVFFFLFFSVWLASLMTSFKYIDLKSFWIFIWSLLLLAGLLSWLGSTQIGLTRILERMDLTRRERLIERMKIIAVTPIAALLETAGAMYATSRWFLGFRKVDWIPTQK